MASHALTPKGTFSDVADTAVWVAAYRARETLRPDPLFRDPFAARLAGERGEQLARSIVESASWEWSIVVRTRMIDELIATALTRGVDTVLNLGAGLDARPYRLELPASLRWIEADCDRLIELKEARLRSEEPRCRLERVRVDLARDEERRALFDRVARDGGNVLVLTEGVVGYLTHDATAALADDLRTRAPFRQWIVDYASPLLNRAVRLRTAIQRPFRNAPLRFSSSDWRGFYRSHGWRVVTMRYHAIEGARLGRPIALPPWFRPVHARLPSTWRRAIDEMMGHALLEPIASG